MKVKGNAGEHLTTLPPYGYMKSPDNKSCGSGTKKPQRWSMRSAYM